MRPRRARLAAHARSRDRPDRPRAWWGDNPKRARTGTERGRFEIIYAGGAGAMQAFGQRLDQDQILQVMAYLEVLREQAE